jgi:hypothetical protein
MKALVTYKCGCEMHILNKIYAITKHFKFLQTRNYFKSKWFRHAKNLVLVLYKMRTRKLFKQIYLNIK